MAAEAAVVLAIVAPALAICGHVISQLRPLVAAYRSANTRIASILSESEDTAELLRQIQRSLHRGARNIEYCYENRHCVELARRLRLSLRNCHDTFEAVSRLLDQYNHPKLQTKKKKKAALDSKLLGVTLIRKRSKLQFVLDGTEAEELLQRLRRQTDALARLLGMFNSDCVDRLRVQLDAPDCRSLFSQISRDYESISGRYGRSSSSSDRTRVSGNRQYNIDESFSSLPKRDPCEDRGAAPLRPPLPKSRASASPCPQPASPVSGFASTLVTGFDSDAEFMWPSKIGRPLCNGGNRGRHHNHDISRRYPSTPECRCEDSQHVPIERNDLRGEFSMGPELRPSIQFVQIIQPVQIIQMQPSRREPSPCCHSDRLTIRIRHR